MRSALIVLLLVTACGTRGDRWEDPLVMLGPAATSDGLVFVDVTHGVLAAVTPGRAAARWTDTVPSARALGTTPAAALVVGGDGSDPVLDVVRIPGLDARRLSLPGAYDRIAVSPDGLHALLFFDPAATPAPGGPPARNLNEVAIVDLAASSVRSVSLDTSSIAPEQVVFSPDGELAAVLLDSSLALVDLGAPDRRVTIPLRLQNGATLAPREAIFAPGGDFLYVRTSGTDVLSVEIVNAGAELGGAVNFLFYPGALAVGDILVPEGDAFRHAVAASMRVQGGTALVLLDAGGDVTRGHAAEVSATMTDLADLGGGLLVAYGDGIDVCGWDPLGDRLQRDALPGSIAAEPRFGPGVAFFPHAQVASGSAAITAAALSPDGARLKLDLRPLVLGGTPVASAVDPATSRLLVAVNMDRFRSGAADYEMEGTTGAIVSVDAGSLALGGLVLDHDVDAMGTVGSYLWARHPGELGAVSLVPLANLRRSAVIEYRGLFASGMVGGDR